MLGSLVLQKMSLRKIKTFAKEYAMNRHHFVKCLPAAIMVALLSYGCAQQSQMPPTAAKPAVEQEAKKAAMKYTGKIVGKSNKAKVVSVAVGKGAAKKVVMVKFDEATKGIKFAKKGTAAIIFWEQRGADKYATVIKPKLAKLPAGVTEIKTEELAELLENNTALTLADARPIARYHKGHLPGAVSIPVPALKKKKAALLPKDKDELLIFYCGGPT